MKIAPVYEALEETGMFEQLIVHTGQHYDEKMSKLFFRDLGIPKPDINLEVGSGSHAFQTAEIMKRFEPIVLKYRPDYVLVVGDVNSTIACTLTASKLGVKIIHVEAGLRSFDRTMPEEINRVLTDAISDLLFTTEKSANENLNREGAAEEKIFFVGNVMIDTLLKHKEKVTESDILYRLGLIDSVSQPSDGKHTPYAILTLHRPSNVDNRENLGNILEALSVITRELPVIFPIHPRTRERIIEFGFDKLPFIVPFNIYNNPVSKVSRGLVTVDPLGYLDFLNLMVNSRIVMTDSGGMQEETTVLQIPCITLRENTERPVTVEKGTNRLVGADKEKIIEESLNALQGNDDKSRIPELWDGKAAKRIADIILDVSKKL
jgi:UDP-N-acetylglucosamine 2-epimerase (non-hydrolysing)